MLNRIDHQQKSKEEMLECLINEHAEEVKKFAYTYVKNWSSAEDITQDVFISVYQNLAHFRGESSYKSWIYKITRNKCYDLLKSKWFSVQMILDSVGEKLKPTTSAEDQVILKSESRELSEKVLKLPLKYREIIILFYYEELKMTEIHQLTGLNMETIKSRLKRGKEKLLQMYGGRTD